MDTPANEVTATASESKAPKVKTVADDMASRRIFPNITEATAYLQAANTEFSDFPKLVESGGLAAAGMDEEGDFDSAIYTPETAVMVALLRRQGKGVKAIVVAPIPTLDQLLANEGGWQWVDRIIQKELNHVAVRHLREAEDVSTVVDQIPTTLEAYITSSRDGGGGIMETFDELYKNINATLAAKLPVWAKMRFTKSELKKAMESKGYASEYYSATEDYKGRSLFVDAINLGILVSKRKGLDPTIFERWLTTRDNKAFTAGDESDEDEGFDLEALTDSLLSEDAAPAEAPAAEGTEAEAPAPDADSGEQPTA
jgi:hypothetical protein